MGLVKDKSKGLRSSPSEISDLWGTPVWVLACRQKMVDGLLHHAEPEPVRSSDSPADSITPPVVLTMV